MYAHLDEVAVTVQGLAAKALDAAGVPHVVQAAGNLFSVFLGRTEPVVDFADAQAQSQPAYKAFFHAMLDHGVYLPPSAFEAWFVSDALDDDALADIERALEPAARAAAATMAA